MVAAIIVAVQVLVSFYNGAMEADADFNRLCWHSRRGMLELDLVLEPFIKEHYRQLSAEDQARYRQLLECEDQDLFSWFLGRVTPQDEDIVRIVGIILAYTHPAH